jgi:flavin-dependent dehydrogenase
MEALMKFDLVVVGGGPGGCAAAITAVRSGARVLLLERGRFPRHKVCGEFVSAESLGLLRDLLPAYSELLEGAPRIPEARVFIDNSVVTAEVHPPAASITRFDLDSALSNSCVSSGVEVRHNCTVQSIGGNRPFVVSVSGKIVEAAAVINATGRWSNLTSPGIRALAIGERWLGLKGHFREVHAPMSVDLYFFDGGYCGVQPVSAASNGSGMRVNACAMVRSDAATTLKDVMSRHPALLERSRNWESLMEPVSTSPLVFHDPEPTQGCMLQVGDAATFVDPFIGDGISLALRSGKMAAECLQPIFQNQCSLEQAAASYSQLYQQRLARVFHASSRLRQLLRWPRVVRKPVLLFLQRTPALTRHIVKMTR